jgi:5-(carboxyamino)imidazole ribonucleotide synthase
MTGGVIGIVGGGQLGRMLTLAAKPLGFDVIVIDPVANSPAAQVGAEQIQADLYDASALSKLAEKADVITVEIEHLDAAALQNVAKIGTSVQPAPKTIQMIQDKLKQKQYFKNIDVPTAPFMEITDEASAGQALKQFGKMVIKTRRGGYDGRGNVVVNNTKQLNPALEQFAGQKLYAEKFVPFTKELAAVVARSLDGKIALYPIVETMHKRNICTEVRAPAAITPLAHKRAVALASKVAQNLEGAGVFAIEMFLADDNKVLLNEVAPRVHNSGHYTLDGSKTSQFEQHIRAITGLPLGSTEPTRESAVMVNILGERNGPTEIRGLKDALAIPEVSVHLYGKSPTKIDRKMGHITATGKDTQTARKRAQRARRRISV